MKVLYLFNRIKEQELKDVRAGRDHDDHFFGMLRLSKYGIEASYLELEQYLPRSVAQFLRRYLLNIHFVHVPLLPLFFKYDIVFTSTAFGSFFLKITSGIKKPKWILFDYNLTGLIGKRRTFKQKILYYLISRSDGIVTISRGEESALRALFPGKKIKFIPLGTDIEFFKPQNTPEENFILSVGRDPGRDFKTLFEAVKDLNIEVKITARPHQLKHFGVIPKNVTIHDFTPQELVVQYARAKLIILPLDIQEGEEYNAMGCSTLVEAMAMGKTIIATETMTMRSYIEHGHSGIFVKKGDSDALRNAISPLLGNVGKRKELENNARSFAVGLCSADLFAKNLADFFRTL